jgi:hypothetical protein
MFSEVLDASDGIVANVMPVAISRQNLSHAVN